MLSIRGFRFKNICEAMAGGLLAPLGYALVEIHRPNPRFLDQPIFKENLTTEQIHQLRNYFGCFDKIHGWCNPRVAEIITLLHVYQKLNAITGCVTELGVLQGKSFLPLYILCEPNHAALAIDIDFAKTGPQNTPSANLSGFLKNIKKINPNPNRQPEILHANSLTLSASKILSCCKGELCRIFSVDGGHTTHHALNDLQLAHKTITPGGVIILDDYFQQGWPGISEGFGAFMRSESIDLCPFLIGFNKIFLTAAQHAQSYRVFIENYLGKPFRRQIFFNSETAIYK